MNYIPSKIIDHCIISFQYLPTEMSAKNHIIQQLDLILAKFRNNIPGLLFRANGSFFAKLIVNF